jgi:hypothetical protein
MMKKQIKKDCEVESKLEILRRVAESVGMSIDDIVPYKP